MTTRNRFERGMSLIEVLVASAILVLAIIIALVVYDASRKAFKKGENATEQQEAVRIAYDKLSTDLRMLGYNVNPDGNLNRPDEQLEGALDHAIVFRGDFDNADATASVNPESTLDDGSFPAVSTGNDEIVAYVLSKPDGTGSDSIAFQVDVQEASRDGDVETVTINNVVLNPTAPPYTLYRVTLNNDSATFGSAGFVTRTPIVENVRDLSFTYYNATSTFKDTSSTIPETAVAKAARTGLTHIGISLVGMTRDQDINYNDAADPASRRFRKFELKGDITPRNMRLKGIQDLNSDFTPPSKPATPTLVAGHCGGLYVNWTPNAVSEGVTQYRVSYGLSAGATAGVRNTSGPPFFLDGLTTGTTYYVSVQAQDAAGNLSTNSNEANATVANTNTPSTPSGISASNDQDYYVRVNWTPTTTNTASVPVGDPGAPQIRDLAGYRLYRYLDATFTPSLSNQVANESVIRASSLPPHYDTPVVACLDYYYMMTAVDACGVESAPTAVFQGRATDPGTKPMAPAGVTANFIGGGQAQISWNSVTKDVADTNINVYAYKVFRSDPIDRNASPASAVWVTTPIATVYSPGYTDAAVPTLGATEVVYYRVTAEDSCPNISDPSTEAKAECAFSGSVQFTNLADGQLVAGVVPTTVAVQSGTDTYTNVTITYTHSVSGLRRTFTSTTPGTTWTDTGWLAAPAGNYTVTATVTNSTGCSKSKTIALTAASTVGCCLALYPTTITPLTCAGGSTGCAEITYKMGNNTCLTAVRVDAMTVAWTDISGNKPKWQTARFNNTNIAAVGTWTTTYVTGDPERGTATKSNFSPGPQVPYANPMAAGNVTSVTYVFDKKTKQGVSRNTLDTNSYTFTLLDSAGVPSDIQTTCTFPSLAIE